MSHTAVFVIVVVNRPPPPPNLPSPCEHDSAASTLNSAFAFRKEMCERKVPTVGWAGQQQQQRVNSKTRSLPWASHTFIRFWMHWVEAVGSTSDQQLLGVHGSTIQGNGEG